MSYSAGINFNDAVSGGGINVQENVIPTNTAYESGRITVGTTEVNVNMTTELASAGDGIFINRGTQDTIQLGWSTGVYDVSIPPGGWAKVNSAKNNNLFVLSSGVNDSDNFEYRVMST